MVIIINGTSSSGKSSIVASLSKKLDGLYFVFGVDKFLEPSMPCQINMGIPEHLKIIDRAISGFNQALGIYAQYIDFMIVDYVSNNPESLHVIAEGLAAKEVFFVGVTAPLSVIEARELERPDRQPGTARAQYELNQSYSYDLVIDTSVLSPDFAADEIIKHLKPGQALKKYTR